MTLETKITVSPVEMEKALETLLLSSKPEDRAQGKLLATGLYEKFDDWLNEGRDNNADPRDYVVAAVAVVGSMLATVISRSKRNEANVSQMIKQMCSTLENLIVEGVKALDAHKEKANGIQS